MRLTDFLKDLGNPVAYYPKLVAVTGGVLPNLFLCQMYYWLGKQKDDQGWIYKTQIEIEQETGLTRKEQESARKSLKARGLLKEQFKGCPRRLEFWLDKDALNQRWSAFMNNIELPIQEITSSWTRKTKKSQDDGDQKPSIMPNLSNIECPSSAIYNAPQEQYILPSSSNTECSNMTGYIAPEGHTVMPDRGNISIYTEITSEITHNAPLAPLPAPPTQESVCEKEELDLTTKEIELEEPTPEKSSLEESTPQQPTSLLNKSESSLQTDNPSCRPTIAVGSFDKNEQSNKSNKPKFQSIEDFIDMVLVDPSIMATDSLPAVYKTEIKMRSWRFPWRTTTRDKIYQTCDRRLVELIAKHRAKWSQSESWQEKIPTVLKSIGNLESSKAGLEELMGYWSQVFQPETTSSPTKQEKLDEKQPIGYFANRSLDWHKATFCELLDLGDRQGAEQAIASFRTRYDQESTGATDGWLNWLSLNYPQIYAHLYHQQAA
ncbi:MAG: hypothetical protein RMZ43_018325 [Nostoc sp. CmiVER01]|uniref:hypothetical protein n=1 Tax=Nostoc sp. CmiVER01 TaxID=3075384 RepID=UPI003D1617D8